MSLSPGTRLGVYEVTAQIGAGGMGEVYRATDSHLKRPVAIKVLPALVAGDVDRLARFQREAEVLAALNHPNIAAIYGTLDLPAEAGSHTALVMEFVDGEDLSAIIARGPIALADALPIARQMADALEAAHEQGIVHRDLKPANIKVRTDGAVKVLDFGLAKAIDPAGAASAEAMNSPTLTLRATQMGVILGTAAYMAPEQAKGKSVDRRADIWAFGVVLYEMLTGRRLFDGEDVSETLAAVLTRDLSAASLPAAIPARLRALIGDCLIRDPKQRLRDIGDARVALDRLIAGATDAAVTTAVGPVPNRALPWTVAGALAVGLVAVLGLWAPWRTDAPADRPVMRLDVDLGDDVSFPVPTTQGSSFAISPDGTRLVYVSGTPPKLFIRRLDRPKATELPGTLGATVPFFSPDGQWVGFLSNGKVNKISVEGGGGVPIESVAGIAGASWGGDGVILTGSKKLLRIPDGGAPETVAEVRGSEFNLHEPVMLPGGKAILFAADNPGPVAKTTIDVVTLADRQRKTLIRGGASPRYVATAGGTGYLLYVNEATLFGIAFDPDTLTTRGTAVPIIDDIAYEALTGTGQFGISRSGTLVYRRASGGAPDILTLQSVDGGGKVRPISTRPDAYWDLSVSPEGKRIALSLRRGDRPDIWIYDLQRDAMTRLTFGGAVHRFPRWTPDGQYVIFGSIGNGIAYARADGASQPQLLLQSKNVQYPFSITPDGTRLAFQEQTGNFHVWTVPVRAENGGLKSGTPERLLENNNSDDYYPAFSPDGRWIAYTSSESAAAEVYVRAFPASSPGQGGRWQISNNGGESPRWSRTGHDLLYQTENAIMAAGYTANGTTFVAEKPRVWIPRSMGSPQRWDVAPDGKGVVVAMPAGSAESPKHEHDLVFVLNFLDELRRRVPVVK